MDEQYSKERAEKTEGRKSLKATKQDKTGNNFPEQKAFGLHIGRAHHGSICLNKKEPG